MTQEDFLRVKGHTIREVEQTDIDYQTGEIVRTKREVTRTTGTEPDYIKIYYKAMMAVNDIGDIPLNFLLALSAQIGFTNGEQVLFYNNKTTRRLISDYCTIGENMTSKYIRRCVEKGILFATRDRGTYEVNPWLIAKGKWDNIKKLQASFEFVNGKWERIIEPADLETEETNNG